MHTIAYFCTPHGHSTLPSQWSLWPAGFECERCSLLLLQLQRGMRAPNKVAAVSALNAPQRCRLRLRGDHLPSTCTCSIIYPHGEWGKNFPVRIELQERMRRLFIFAVGALLHYTWFTATVTARKHRRPVRS